MRLLRNEYWMKAALVLLGVSQVALGAWQGGATRSFYDAIANFGPYSEHALRDFSTYFLALGVLLIVSAFRSSWRAPLLTLALLQYVLHALNHLYDVGRAQPGYIGPLDLVALSVTAAVFFAVLESSWAQRGRPEEVSPV